MPTFHKSLFNGYFRNIILPFKKKHNFLEHKPDAKFQNNNSLDSQVFVTKTVLPMNDFL